MDILKLNTTGEIFPKTDKKTYITPVLTELGGVGELIKSGTAAGAVEGSGSDVYQS